MGIGTYAFNTASHVWRQVGQWALPLYGRVEYAPELKLWLGISDYCNPSPRPMLCALDLSAMDNAQGLPMPQRAWDYLDLRHDYNDDNMKTVIHGVHLANLGSGMFCIATEIMTMVSPICTSHDEEMVMDTSDEEANGMVLDYAEEDFVILTGVKVERCCGCDGLRMIKHTSKRYDLLLRGHTLKAVL
jgi:hypothetical protein